MLLLFRDNTELSVPALGAWNMRGILAKQWPHDEALSAEFRLDGVSAHCLGHGVFPI